MTENEMKRLVLLEKRIHKFFEDNGMNTTSINFEIVTAERMIEALAYRLPSNYSHWSFGRNFEREETQYRHSGHGIPYEVVWNFDNPTALLVDTNPFALNVLILAHVYGHVDFHLSNMFMRRGRSIADVYAEARSAKKRFLEYEKLYGVEEVEKVIEAALAFQYHQDPDPFAEYISEEEMRKRLVDYEKENLHQLQKKYASLTSVEEKKEMKTQIGEQIRRVYHCEHHTPPTPEYDVLKYLLEKSPVVAKPWVQDIVTVVREQIRALAPNFRTKLMNEGWATFWHIRALKQLLAEGLISYAEMEEAIQFHAKVVRKIRTTINVYNLGPAFWEMIEDRWDKGKHGAEWEACRDREARSNWDKKEGLGRKKILELRKTLSDRMAVENYFDDDFIHDEQLYIYQSHIDEETGEEVFVIVENNPKVMRSILTRMYSNFGFPTVAVTDGNSGGTGQLVLEHFFSGFELDPKYENGALEKLYYLWGRPVHLITYEIVSVDQKTGVPKLKQIHHYYDGRNHTVKDLK